MFRYGSPTRGCQRRGLTLACLASRVKMKAMPNAATVTVELFGIPRQRAGQTELAASAGTLFEVLTDVQRQCPRLESVVGGIIAPHFRISLNGERFLTDLGEPLPAGSRILILSA